jgi:hypothetical protein
VLEFATSAVLEADMAPAPQPESAALTKITAKPMILVLFKADVMAGTF